MMNIKDKVERVEARIRLELYLYGRSCLIENYGLNEEDTDEELVQQAINIELSNSFK